MSLNTIYITDGSLKFGSRHDDYELKQKIKEKWEVVENCDQMICGNLNVTFKDNIAKVSDKYDCTQIQSHRQISSALALYRTISLFECRLSKSGVDYYKSNWQVNLTHKKTKIALSLGEWKGGFQIFTPYVTMSEIDNNYKKDVEELLTLLVSPTMTINYDGTIAGTVA